LNWFGLQLPVGVFEMKASVAETIPNPTVEELAVFGGTAAFDQPLHVGRPNIGDRQVFEQRVRDILDHRWLSNDGPYVQQLEQRIKEFVGVKHCIAMCNATIALEIAIRALGMTGEVIIPSFTFVASAHALQWQEITPVFCDIDPQTRTLDPNKVEELITPRTTGIMGVHVFGRPCAIEALTEIAERRGLKLLFDSAHAFGCSYEGRMIGGFGHAEVFSFHATKFINTLEGGAVVTNDDELAQKIRLMKNFGFTFFDQVEYVGTNGKMNEVSGAMGLTNLESVDEFIGVNRRNFELYRRGLEAIPGISLMVYDEREHCNFQYVVVDVDEGLSGISRDEIQKTLWAENVLARRYFYPGCHQVEPYRTNFPDLRLPETERLTQRVMTLPTGTAVGESEITRICQLIRLVVANSDAVRNQLKQRALSESFQPSHV
jgi:dTDP-4-amino-4,6-dideoxygalactose transaminase